MKKYNNIAAGMLPNTGIPAQGKTKPTPPKAPKPQTPPAAPQGAPSAPPMPVMPSQGAPMTPGMKAPAGGGMGGPMDGAPAMPPMAPPPDAGAAPMAPPDVGGAMPPMPGSNPGGLSIPDPSDDPEANKASLGKLRDQVDNKEKAVATSQIISKNQLEAMRAELVQNIFQQMKKIGVDMNDPKSVSNFVQNLYLQDPDLYMLFEMAFNGLTGTSSPNGDPGQPPAGIDMSSMMGGAMPSGPGGMLGGGTPPPPPMPPDMPPAGGAGAPMPPPGGMPPTGDPAAQFGGLSGALGQPPSA